MPATLVKLVLAAVGGVLVAAVGSAVHQAVAGAHRWPVGLLLALGLTALWGALLGRRAVPALVRVAGVAGWTLVVLLVSPRRPEGDVLVPGNGRGYGWMLAGFALLVVLAVLPARAAADPRS
ncbi:hypothetical protein GCM10027446_06330 [Angustibacter peucedani]